MPPVFAPNLAEFRDKCFCMCDTVDYTQPNHGNVLGLCWIGAAFTRVQVNDRLITITGNPSCFRHDAYEKIYDEVFTSTVNDERRVREPELYTDALSGEQRYRLKPRVEIDYLKTQTDRNINGNIHVNLVNSLPINSIRDLALNASPSLRLIDHSNSVYSHSYSQSSNNLLDVQPSGSWQGSDGNIYGVTGQNQVVSGYKNTTVVSTSEVTTDPFYVPNGYLNAIKVTTVTTIKERTDTLGNYPPLGNLPSMRQLPINIGTEVETVNTVITVYRGSRHSTDWLDFDGLFHFSTFQMDRGSGTANSTEAKYAASYTYTFGAGSQTNNLSMRAYRNTPNLMQAELHINSSQNIPHRIEFSAVNGTGDNRGDYFWEHEPTTPIVSPINGPIEEINSNQNECHDLINLMVNTEPESFISKETI